MFYESFSNLTTACPVSICAAPLVPNKSSRCHLVSDSRFLWGSDSMVLHLVRTPFNFPFRCLKGGLSFIRWLSLVVVLYRLRGSAPARGESRRHVVNWLWSRVWRVQREESVTVPIWLQRRWSKVTSLFLESLNVSWSEGRKRGP